MYFKSLTAIIALQEACALVVRTPNTAKIFANYRATLPADLNVVQAGGWYALELQAVTAEGRKQLAAYYQDYLPVDYDAVGNATLLEQIAGADPKQVLVQYMTEMTKSGETAFTKSSADVLEAVTALLYAQGKGYNDSLVDGEWLMVMQRQGNKSPSAQQFVGKAEKAGKTDNIFDTKSSSFYTSVKFWRDRGMVDSTVQYTPVDNGATVSKEGTLMPRRIMCDITDAGVKLFRLPRLRLKFLQRKGGYLDFVYLDKDIRVTRGNRGGLFFHGRPAFVEKMLAGEVL